MRILISNLAHSGVGTLFSSPAIVLWVLCAFSISIFFLARQTSYNIKTTSELFLVLLVALGASLPINAAFGLSASGTVLSLIVLLVMCYSSKLLLRGGNFFSAGLILSSSALFLCVMSLSLMGTLLGLEILTCSALLFLLIEVDKKLIDLIFIVVWTSGVSLVLALTGVLFLSLGGAQIGGSSVLSPFGLILVFLATSLKLGLQPMGVWVFKFYTLCSARLLTTYITCIYPVNMLIMIKILVFFSQGALNVPILTGFVFVWSLGALGASLALYSKVGASPSLMLVVSSTITLSLILLT